MMDLAQANLAQAKEKALQDLSAPGLLPALQSCRPLVES